MAILTPSNLNADIPRLETTDVALGGTSGIMNSQAQALLNKITYGANRIEQGFSNLIISEPTAASADLKLSLGAVDRAIIDKNNTKFLDLRTATPDWISIHSYNGVGTSYATGSTIDSQGNVFYCGQSSPTGILGVSGVSLVKMDKFGAVLWSLLYQSSTINTVPSGEAIHITSTDDVIVVVHEQDTVLNASRELVMKISGVDGHIIWQKYLDNNNAVGSRGSLVAFTLDSADNIYLTGGTDTLYVSHITKVDSSGAILWARGYSSALLGVSPVMVIPQDIVVDTDGSIYLSVSSAYGSTNQAVMKFDSIGTFIWVNSFALNPTGTYWPLNEYSYGIDVSPSGVHMVSYLQGEGGNTICIYKLDKSTGVILWSEHIGYIGNNTSCYSIYSDKITGDVFLTRLLSNEGVGILCLNSSGAYKWSYMVTLPSTTVYGWWNWGFKDAFLRDGYLTSAGEAIQGVQNNNFILHVNTSSPLSIGNFGVATVSAYPITITPSPVILGPTPPMLSVAFVSAATNGDMLPGVPSAMTVTEFTFKDKTTLETNNLLAETVTTPYLHTTATSTVYGVGALPAINTGSGVTAIGAGALASSLASGINNTAVGNNSQAKSTTASNNTSLGYGSLFSNTVGDFNIAVGGNSLYNSTTSSYNIAIGESALGGITVNSSYNLAIGSMSSLYATGSCNTVLGSNSGNALTSGNLNTLLGYGISGPSTGTNNVFIGNTQSTINNPTNSIVIGNNIGDNGSNTTVIGSPGTTDTYLVGHVHCTGNQVTTSKQVIPTAALTAVTLTAANTYLSGTTGASLAVTLPIAAATLDGFKYVISSTVARAAVTWISTGATVNAVSSLAANIPVALQYDHATLSWYSTI